MPNATQAPTPPERPEDVPAPAGTPRRLRARTGVAIAAVALLAVVLAGLVLGGRPATGDLVAAGGSATPGPAVIAATASPATPSLAGTPGASPSPSPATPAPATPAPATPAPATPGPEPTSAPPTAAPSVGPTAAPSSDPTGVPARQLQARLDRLRDRMDIPGVSVAILWDDGRGWAGVSGLRDVKHGEPMTTGTAFALASVSKTLTAAVVLQLVDEGRISLDDRVAKLLPGYRLHPRITVRQLLDHTSGLPDYFLNGSIDRPLQSKPDAAWTPEQAFDYVAPLRKRASPGREWRYSNTNYLLLGELVEGVTGRPLAAEIRERLLDPLDLGSAWYQGEEEPRATGTLAYRLVTRPDGTERAVRVAPRSDVMPFRSVVTAAGGAGSIAATAGDAARWMRAFAHGDVVSPELHAEMLADVYATSRLGAPIPYGLGIQALPLDGRVALGHSGRFLGFRNVVRYLPAEGVTISVLTNQGDKDPSRIAEKLLQVVLPRAPRPVPSP